MEYIPRTATKIGYYNRPKSSLEKSYNSITAEASDIENTILFNGKP